VFVSRKVVSGKPLSRLSCVCLPLEKLINRKHFSVNGKHFPVKGKFSLVSRKVFSFYFGWKTLSGSCEKFRNVILFTDYIKFGPQTFDCYIYILFWIFVFQFHPLEFNFYIKAMFVSRNSLSGKPLSKLSCVCLPLGNLVNGKHFPVNENTFRSTENTFQSKKNLVWFPGKCFPFWLCLFSGKWFPGNHFPNFLVFVCH